MATQAETKDKRRTIHITNPARREHTDSNPANAAWMFILQKNTMTSRIMHVEQPNDVHNNHLEAATSRQRRRKICSVLLFFALDSYIYKLMILFRFRA